jgi:hypothetical protein
MLKTLLTLQNEVDQLREKKTILESELEASMERVELPQIAPIVLSVPESEEDSVGTDDPSPKMIVRRRRGSFNSGRSSSKSPFHHIGHVTEFAEFKLGRSRTKPIKEQATFVKLAQPGEEIVAKVS